MVRYKEKMNCIKINVNYQDRVIPKTMNKMVPVVPSFSTQHEITNIGSFSNSNNIIFEGLMED